MIITTMREVEQMLLHRCDPRGAQTFFYMRSLKAGRPTPTGPLLRCPKCFRVGKLSMKCGECYGYGYYQKLKPYAPGHPLARRAA